MRLIDAGALLEEVRYHAKYAKEQRLASVYNGISIACGEIIDAPTIEAEPVRHGRWIVHDDEWGLTNECSECHAEGMIDGNYCPNCGAKMMDEVSE